MFTHSAIGLQPIPLRQGAVEDIIQVGLKLRIVGRASATFEIDGDEHSLGGVIVQPVIQAEEHILESGMWGQQRCG